MHSNYISSISNQSESAYKILHYLHAHAHSLSYTGHTKYFNCAFRFGALEEKEEIERIKEETEK